MKIALVAMSGIRACDPELLELGLTLPGFVERSRAIARLPSLGLLTLGGLTPPRHEVRYIELGDARTEEGVAAVDALAGEVDLVAISSFTAQIREAYSVARRLQDRGVLVVIGGLHVTSLPEEPVGLGISAVAGQGELAWPEVLRDAERGELAPLYDVRGRTFDLARAPMPAFELLGTERYERVTVQTSRGCPWKCSFCASSILLTPRYEQKPRERVLAEIDRISELWSRPFIELADDNSFVNRRYWRQLLPDLEKRHLRWFTETDISVADDERLLDAIAAAGCEEVLIGLESPSVDGLGGIELTSDWKLGRQPRYIDAVRRIQSRGIRVNACFVVGLDGHTASVFDGIVRFVEEAAPFDVLVTYLTPFPGTPLYENLKREGRLTHETEWERYTLFDINYAPWPLDAASLRSGFHDLVRRLYSEESTRWRHERFRENLRALRRRRRRFEEISSPVRHRCRSRE